KISILDHRPQCREQLDHCFHPHAPPRPDVVVRPELPWRAGHRRPIRWGAKQGGAPATRPGLVAIVLSLRTFGLDKRTSGRIAANSPQRGRVMHLPAETQSTPVELPRWRNQLSRTVTGATCVLVSPAAGAGPRSAPGAGRTARPVTRTRRAIRSPRAPGAAAGRAPASTSTHVPVGPDRVASR